MFTGVMTLVLVSPAALDPSLLGETFSTPPDLTTINGLLLMIGVAAHLDTTRLGAVRRLKPLWPHPVNSACITSRAVTCNVTFLSTYMASASLSRIAIVSKKSFL
jgi:hypothetical protein